ncbi:MAG TPA: MalY/PatB family protein [Algoriphagus sp.]|nr:MalY/PatB family protein [Algoriphagus sp.]
MDFDEVVDRRGTNTVKWDSSAEEKMLPMWIADMDFRSPASIQAALANRARHGIFGYTRIPDAFFQAIGEWWERSHGMAVDRDLIVPLAGVLPAITAILRSCMLPGQKVIVQPPVYNRFFEAIQNSGSKVVENNLKYLEEEYTFDFEDLEKKATDSETKVLLLCNPHNPVGRSWNKVELGRLSKICSENGLIVISDEVHSDLVYDAQEHIPFASIAREYEVACFTLGSPGKSFNLSGLQVAYLFCPDKQMKLDVENRLEGANELNVFAVEGLIAAYSHENFQWLSRLKAYLYDNYLFLKHFFNSRLPEVRIARLEATYLVWMDCRQLNKTSHEIQSHLLQAEKLWLVSGELYGGSGEGFLRINIACPRKDLEEGLLRFERGYRSL